MALTPHVFPPAPNTDITNQSQHSSLPSLDLGEKKNPVTTVLQKGPLQPSQGAHKLKQVYLSCVTLVMQKKTE